jgi:subtilisin family serine protease
MLPPSPRHSEDQRVPSRRWLIIAGLVASLLVASVPGVQAAGGQARFIVVLRDSVDAPRAVAAEHRQRYGAEVSEVYRHALKGYAARLDESKLGALRSDRRVAWIERDQRVSIDTTQSPATWGLDRIDQAGLPLNNTYSYQRTGSGVTAYVIDTGIRTSHQQFGGRAVSGVDQVDGALPAADCNGHGTHVAGTIGGSVHGVAKGASLVAVRVLDCAGSGYWSWIIAGIDWVAGNHQPGQPAVANMSLGGGASSAVDTAVRNAVADGITFVVAAGNSSADACRTSPARVSEALTVGATTSSDARASYSNYGTCLDLFAPGSSITSAWSSSDSATNTISGTSMASPHVAGVAALLLQDRDQAPAAVARTILADATGGVVGGLASRKLSGTPNLLLRSRY